MEVSFIDDNSTADIRVVGDKGGYGAVWIMNGKNSKAIIQKMDASTYLVTGNLT